MNVKTGQAITALFTTHSATTGAATDATGTPTGTLYVNGTSNGATVTVTNITTGLYKAALTLPSLSAGDSLALRISATVSGVSAIGVVWQAIGDTVLASDNSAKLDTIDDFLDTEIAAIKAKTDNLPSDPSDASDIASSFTAVNAKLDTIDDFLDTEIAAIKAKTDLIPSDPADASDIATSFGVVDTALSAIAGYVDTEVSAIKAKTDNLPASFPTNFGSLSITASGNVSVGAIAADAITASALATDAVTEIANAANATLSAAHGNSSWEGGGGGGGDATEANQLTILADLDTIAGYLDTEIAAIKAKTDNLPSDPADASDIASSFTTVNTKLDTIDDFLDTEIAAIKAKTDNLPSDPSDASDIASSFTAVNAKLDTIDDFLDTEIAAIKAKTDLIPSDPADASDIATSFGVVDTALSAIAGYVDTEVSAIKAKTDNLPASFPTNFGSLSITASGNVSVGAIAADAITASALATDAVTEIANAANATLSAAHGNSSWETGASGNVTAIAEAVDTLLSTNHGSGAWGATGAGSGAYPITVRVTDGTDPLENAAVRVIEGATSAAGVTNADGEIEFALDSATYSVYVSKPGYTMAPESRTVTGEETGTLTDDLEMTIVVIPSPDDPDMSNVAGSFIRPDGSPAAGAVLFFELIASEAISMGGNLVHGRKFEVILDALGRITSVENGQTVLWKAIPRNDLAIPSTSQWQVYSDEVGLIRVRFTLNSGTFDMSTLAGS
jgi:hypothetical protein